MGTDLHHEVFLHAERLSVSDDELPADLLVFFVVPVDERGPGCRTQSVHHQVVADFCGTDGE